MTLRTPPPLPNKGFTLVEVMVAMVIGMLGLIIMMQVFSAAEGQRRATTGSGDAQSNGAMALYALQRDIRQAGYGFTSVSVFGCPLTLLAPASRTLTQLAPVIINPPVADIPAGDANSDTLLVAYGNNEGPPEGDQIILPTATSIAVQAASNYHLNQWLLRGPPRLNFTCGLELAQITGEAVFPDANISVALSSASEGDAAFNLGDGPRILAYAVRGGNLTVCNYMTTDCNAAANYVAIANNIVSLRAEYGHASTAVSGVDTWNQTTPANANQCLRAGEWARTSALRIAVVARNSQVERDAVTAAAPVWTGAAAIDLSGRANWQNYRYKVFETTIPIRNLPWMALDPC